MKTNDSEITVFISTRGSTCSECGEDLGPHAWITLAVVAHIRHTETEYDKLLMRGVDRYDARRIISDKINQVLEKRGESP